MDEFQTAEVATSNEYEILDDFTWLKFKTKSGSIIIENTDATNSLDATVMASPLSKGEEFHAEVQAEVSIAAGEVKVVNFSDYYPRMRIYVRSTTADQSATVKAAGSAIAV